MIGRAWARAAASLRPRVDDAPIVADAAAMTLVEVLRRFWPRLRGLRGRIALSLLVLAVVPLLQVVEVMLFQRLVDDVLVPADPGPLLALALLYVGLNLASGVVSGIDDCLSTWISQRFLVDLRRDVFAHLLALPGQVHDRRRLGDTVARLTSDVAAVERFMVSHLAGGVSALLSLLWYAAAMFWIQWELALASLVTVPLLAWVARRFGRLTRTVSRERRRRGGSLTSITEESLANVSLVQLYGREREAVAAYHRQSSAIAHAELAASRIRALFQPLVDLAELTGVLGVVGLGVWALATGRLSLGELLAFLTLLTQCYRPLRQLGDLLPDLYSASAGVERLAELLDEPAAADRPEARPLRPTRGEIEVRGLVAAYDGAPAPALDGLDLHVRPGERVAVVGPSGSGKSTLVRVLSRHLEPVRGQVLVDGQDLARCTGRSVREAVVVVPQETLLPDDTVAEVIRYGVPGASRAAVEAAARAADAHEFVLRLPLGYDTRVGQRGRTLSGGQRQRLALARALLRESAVLVLDEPTTGLDAEASGRFLESLLVGAGRRTVVVLTHDPLVLERMDRVVDLGAASAPRMAVAT